MTLSRNTLRNAKFASIGTSKSRKGHGRRDVKEGLCLLSECLVACAGTSEIVLLLYD
jgi:hypothetical protein